MKKIILLPILCIFSIVSFAQASGGQIRRSSDKSQRNNRATIIAKTYPQRDEVFNDNVDLPVKNSFSISNLNINFILLPAPDFDGHVLKRNMNRKQISLKQISCKKGEDYYQWLQSNGLQSKKEQVRSAINMLVLRYRIKTGGYHALLLGDTYGDIRKVIVTDENEKNYYAAYDFENFRSAPKRDKSDKFSNDQEIIDIVIEGNIMYVAHSGHTYSVCYGNQNGYISAINMLTDEIIWTSQPKINNCSEFVIVGNSIITGYGFTDEPDFLFVLDKYSGQRIQKIPLKKGPGIIMVKNNCAYVQTYNLDYVFAIQ